MRVRTKAALEEFKGGSAIAVVGFATKLSYYPFKALAYKAVTLAKQVLNNKSAVATPTNSLTALR